MTVEVPSILIGLLLVAAVVAAWVALACYVNRRWIAPWIKRKVERAEPDGSER